MGAILQAQGKGSDAEMTIRDGIAKIQDLPGDRSSSAEAKQYLLVGYSFLGAIDPMRLKDELTAAERIGTELEQYHQLDAAHQTMLKIVRDESSAGSKDQSK